MYLDMVLDLVLAHYFHFQILIGVKILLFLEWAIVDQCMLIIKKYILVFDKHPTQEFDGTNITDSRS